MNLVEREDRIAEYLVRHLNNDFLFDELSDAYLTKIGLLEEMKGVPIPLRKTDLGSLSTLTIALNMAFVFGCDPKFEYRNNYLKFIEKAFDKRFAEGLIAQGVESAQKNDFDYACIMFRAAMIVDPANIDALYCYGRACKDSYELGEEEDYIARYKAESIEAFEEVTLRRPDFAEAFYFLGYGYLNLGLYVKAKLTWEEFLKLTDNQDMIDEIKERLSQLDEPVEIEEGYNLVISGKYEEGIAVLSQYKDGKYNKWWPLWYYLGIAHMELSEFEEAISEFKEVLVLSPSNVDAMEEIIKAYEAIGDTEKVEKYTKKIAVIEENREKDREEAAKGKKLN